MKKVYYNPTLLCRSISVYRWKTSFHGGSLFCQKKRDIELVRVLILSYLGSHRLLAVESEIGFGGFRLTGLVLSKDCALDFAHFF